MPRAQRDGSARGSRTGWGVLLAWCLVVGMSFWTILGASHAGTAATTLTAPETALIGSWITTSPNYRPGRPTVAWLGDGACTCEPAASEHWQRLRARWGRRNTALYELDPQLRRPQTLAHVEIVVADAAGRPVYAGAFENRPMCGNTTEMDVIVASAHALPTSLPARTSNRTCECP